MYIKRAAGDTIKHAGGFGSLAFIVLGGALSVAYTAATEGWAKVSWASILPGLAISIGAGVVLFLINLACTPFRIEREKNVELEERVRGLEEKVTSLEENPDFRVTIQEIGINGTPTGNPPRHVVFAMVSVTNLGKIPSALPTWQVIIRGQGQEDVQLVPSIFQGGLTATSRAGLAMTYPDSSMIANQTLDPMPIGSIKHGYIAADSLEPWLSQLDGRHTIIVKCWDIYGNSYEGKRQIGSGNELERGMYFPGTGQKMGGPE